MSLEEQEAYLDARERWYRQFISFPLLDFSIQLWGTCGEFHSLIYRGAIATPERAEAIAQWLDRDLGPIKPSDLKRIV